MAPIADKFVHVLPGIQIAISIVASLVYGLAKDWKHCSYWILGAAITACVTAMKK
jgi:hypothetical protein